jgi:NAD+ kinase
MLALTGTGDLPWASMRIGLVVHPSRHIDEEVSTIREWAEEHTGEVVQVGEQERHVADEGRVDDCDLVITLGGDGTMLTGIRAASAPRRPVLGAACGSLGVLTKVGAEALRGALDRFATGDWVAQEMPALKAVRDDGEEVTALNDMALVRSGEGQVTTEACVDRVLYARSVGDGFVVSTPVGSSAYTLAAGGPLLAPGTTAFVFTPLSSHGGTAPPLVVGGESELALDVDLGHGDARLEVDGETHPPPRSLRLELQPSVATLVTYDDAEPALTALRRHEIITDSPRVIARDERGE